MSLLYKSSKSFSRCVQLRKCVYDVSQQKMKREAGVASFFCHCKGGILSMILNTMYKHS